MLVMVGIGVSVGGKVTVGVALGTGEALGVGVIDGIAVGSEVAVASIRAAISRGRESIPPDSGVSAVKMAAAVIRPMPTQPTIQKVRSVREVREEDRDDDCDRLRDFAIAPGAYRTEYDVSTGWWLDVTIAQEWGLLY